MRKLVDPILSWCCGRSIASGRRPVAGMFLVSLAALSLSACVTPPPEPDWSATWPELPPPASQGNGAIYQAGHDISLFENAVARRVGDTLTIKLNERTNASKSSSTSTKKATTVEAPGPTIAGRPVTVHGTPVLNTQIGNEARFDGEGASSQSNRLEGQITVTVAQRLPNGNLLVRGQKWITINQGREYVRIQGIVRPIDIEPDNSISSLKVADAMIAYGAQGALADANKPGLLSRFFNLPFMPF
ncbi:MAG TPA: flagellar basal body L-ring protein FlgH [Steroidobacter sp.]